jgi:signal transduction histidine kinase
MSAQEQYILVQIIVGTLLFITLGGFIVMLIYVYQKRLQVKQKELFDAVLLAQEQEQERIARDLHDQIGPAFSIIRSQISCIDETVLSADDRQLKHDVMQQVTDILKEVRSISHNLIPKSFSEKGFEFSIKDYVMRISEYNDVSVEFTLNNWPEKVGAGYSMTIYRIIQELVHNTLKHANAKQIKLLITSDKKQLNIEYADDGRGFDQSSHEGLGKQNIEVRTRMLGGKYICNTSPGCGVNYSFTFDLRTLYA